MNSRLPDFIGIGTQKAGTTWLYEQLNAHSEISFPNVFDDEPEYFKKEIHFFDIPERYAQGFDFYAQRFQNLSGRYCGEITPNYCVISDEKIVALKKMRPDVKIIFLLRHPVERAWSSVMHYIGVHNGDPFNSQDIFYWVRQPWLQAMGHYCQILKTWLTHFPREQVFIGHYEHIRTKPANFLSDIMSFLDLPVEIDQELVAKHFNVGADIEIDARTQVYLKEIYSESLKELKRDFPDIAHSCSYEL